MNSPGQHDMTDIIGTKGKLSVNAHPTSSLLESHTANGIHRDIPQNFFERFEHAFMKEAQQFTDAVLDEKPVPIDLESSVLAVSIGTLLQESLRSGKKISFDRAGKREEEAVKAEW
jgi:myo-inositol 2-dehydrogenase/D-chiro-inositol 1-dehydrogenase